MKKVYADPYINRQTGVLKNLLGISDRDKLDVAEAKITGVAMRKLQNNPVQGDFDFAHLCKIHEKIFEKIYEWAGTQRVIDIEKPERVLAWHSIEYSPCDEIQRNASMILRDMKKVNWESLLLDQKVVEFSRYMADLWKVHPFREGNTRTTVTFCCDFAESRGFGIDRDLFKDNSEFVRTALVAASAKFSDNLGDKSQPEHLQRIVKDGMEMWEKAHHPQDKKNSMEDWKKQITQKRESNNAGKAELPKERKNVKDHGDRK